MDILRFIFFALFIHFICRSGVIFMMSMVLCLLPLQEDVLAQTRLDDKVLDGQPHQRWLLCKGSDLDLVMDPLPSPAHCYKWYRRDQPGQAFALLPDEGSRISVNPVRTAWYRCERYPKNAQTQCSGVPDKIQYFKVYVVEGPDLSYVWLNGEIIYTRDQGTIGQPETMDEYIDYQICGGPTVYYYGDLTSMEVEKMLTNIHFTSSNNQVNQTFPFKPESAFQFGFSEKDFTIPQVTQDGASKEYELRIRLEYCGMFSPEVKIKVKRLWIEYFHHNSKSLGSSEWKVVMNDEVRASAFATSKCNNFKWEMNNSELWTLENNFSQTPAIQNMIFKPANGQYPQSNNDLGPAKGIIRLSCTYNLYYGPKTMTLYSNCPNQPGPKQCSPETNARYMGFKENHRASVFFHLYDQTTDELDGGKSVPVWLYYWRQVFKQEFPCFTGMFFDDNVKLGSHKGYTLRPAKGELNKPGHQYSFNQKTYAPTTTPREERVRDYTGKLGGQKVKGIDAYYLLLAHENFHCEIWKKEYTQYFNNQYSASKDNDCPANTIGAGDYYHDDHELEYNHQYPDFGPFYFSKDYDDYYLFEKIIDSCKNPNRNDKWPSEGFRFEEFGGMHAEGETLKNNFQFHNKDWSYDKKNFIQGKQW